MFRANLGTTVGKCRGYATRSRQARLLARRRSSALATCPMQHQPDENILDETSSVWVRGLYDYKGTDTSALSFEKGAIIEVFNQLETGWWDGVLDDERGWFPSNYVQLLTPQETEAHLASLYESAQEQSHSNAWDTDDSGWSGTNAQSNYSSRDVGLRPKSMADDFWMPQVSVDGQVGFRL